MNLLETELAQLKTNVVEMWDVVINQIQKARDVIESGNQDMVHEMAAGEKWIDSISALKSSRMAVMNWSRNGKLISLHIPWTRFSLKSFSFAG